MDKIKASLTSAKWWLITGLAMGAGVALTLGLGAPLGLGLVVGSVAPFVGAFAHVLAGAGE